MLPTLFIERIRHTFPEAEADEFIQAISQPPAISVRLHPLKKYSGFKDTAQVPWNDEGLYLQERPEFIFDPAFHAGAYYVQESSSMFVRKALKKIEIPRQGIALDLCAAPGGKSTLLLSHLPSDCLLVANEVIRTRVPALKENIQRWGFPNVMVTNADPADFETLPETFDLILVDAPCSGEGMFRKDLAAREHWSLEALQTCELRQRRILKSAAKALKVGGYLIYSTCTFNPGENEAQMQELLENGFEILPVLSSDEFSEIARIMIGNGEGYAFYPHKVKGEGFFLALLRKVAETDGETPNGSFRKPFFEKTVKTTSDMEKWLQKPSDFVWKERNGVVYALPANLEKNMQMVAASVQTMYAGVAAGSSKGNEFIPDHALALSTIIKDDIPHISLTEEESLHYLKKETIRSHEVSKGIYTVRFDNLNLGWVKAIPGRLNNLLPMEFRIRKNIEW